MRQKKRGDREEVKRGKEEKSRKRMRENGVEEKARKEENVEEKKTVTEENGRK